MVTGLIEESVVFSLEVENVTFGNAYQTVNLVDQGGQVDVAFDPVQIKYKAEIGEIKSLYPTKENNYTFEMISSSGNLESMPSYFSIDDGQMTVDMDSSELASFFEQFDLENPMVNETLAIVRVTSTQLYEDSSFIAHSDVTIKLTDPCVFTSVHTSDSAPTFLEVWQLQKAVTLDLTDAFSIGSETGMPQSRDEFKSCGDLTYELLGNRNDNGPYSFVTLQDNHIVLNCFYGSVGSYDLTVRARMTDYTMVSSAQIDLTLNIYESCFRTPSSSIAFTANQTFQIPVSNLEMIHNSYNGLAKNIIMESLLLQLIIMFAFILTFCLSCLIGFKVISVPNRVTPTESKRQDAKTLTEEFRLTEEDEREVKQLSASNFIHDERYQVSTSAETSINA